ncbi:MAG: tetratricopeptide repeat protein [Thermoanaerobaculia bacterium]
MTLPRIFSMPRLLAGLVLASLSIGALPAGARDVYRNFLDPGIPQHRAILDTLERLKTNPKDPALHNDLGCLIARDGFWRDALREFDTAASLDKKDAHPLFNAGLVHAYKGEWGGARRSFAAATRRDPGNWTAWWMLGYANERLGETEAAVDAYKVSVRFDTSLFDVARNSFAADTQLKARVLLETYSKRRIRTAMPEREQFDDPDRISSFFQRGRVTVTSVAAAPAPPVEEPVQTRSGPVVSAAPPSTTGGASSTPTKSGPPTFQRPSRVPRNVPPPETQETLPPIPGIPVEEKPVPPQPAPGTKKPPQPGPGGMTDD